VPFLPPLAIKLFCGRSDQRTWINRIVVCSAVTPLIHTKNYVILNRGWEHTGKADLKKPASVYSCYWEWADDDWNVCRSPVSDPSKVATRMVPRQDDDTDDG
jgi:uncharacterized membrane protein YqaE (UPF0057 family)